jgi:hypothetical protein
VLGMTDSLSSVFKIWLNTQILSLWLFSFSFTIFNLYSGNDSDILLTPFIIFISEKSGKTSVLCFFVCFFFLSCVLSTLCWQVFLDCPFLIASWVLSNVYFNWVFFLTMEKYDLNLSTNIQQSENFFSTLDSGIIWNEYIDYYITQASMTYYETTSN